MSTFSGQPSVVRFDDDLVYASAMGSDGAVYYIVQTAASNGWGGWNPLGGPANSGRVKLAGSPVVFASPETTDEDLVCQAMGEDGVLYQNDQGPEWFGWRSIGTPAVELLAGSPAVSVNETQRPV